jgi:hypothetical protein
MSRVSVWLSKALFRKARKLAPRRERSNFGCIVSEALRDHIVRREREAFDRGMRRMAKDEQAMKAMNALYRGHPKRRRK